jgi:hypothetical protein
MRKSYKDADARGECTKHKYAKLEWPQGGFVIVKNCTEYNPFPEEKECKATLIYGSKRKFVSSGQMFFFNKYLKLTELNEDEVLKNYWPGLI